MRDEGLIVRMFFNDHNPPHFHANFYSDLSEIDKVDWARLTARDFRRDVDDPEKIERYQAEALVYWHVPVAGLLGVACQIGNGEVRIGGRNRTRQSASSSS